MTYWPLFRKACSLLSIVALIVAAAPLLAQGVEETDEEASALLAPGLLATYADASGADYQRVEPIVALARNTSAENLVKPSPSARQDRLVISYDGYVTVQIPGEYRFFLSAVGNVQFSVGGKQIIGQRATEPSWLESQPVELAFGRHSISIRYASDGESRLRLFWASDAFPTEPIAERWLSHDISKETGDARERGQRLVRAARCDACHARSGEMKTLPAPALDQLNGNLSFDWIVERLAFTPTDDLPLERFPARKMPHFLLSTVEAEAIAAYLTETPEPPAHFGEDPQAGNPKRGENLFLKLGCLACHEVDGNSEAQLFDGGNLSRIAAKRPASFFQRWLSKPDSVNRDHRMPVFKLAQEEIRDLSAYLARRGANDRPAPRPSIAANRAALVARGKTLVEEHRCAACHRLPDDFKPTKDGLFADIVTAPPVPIARLRLDGSKGCLGETHPLKGRPRYLFSESDLTAIRSWLNPPRTQAGFHELYWAKQQAAERSLPGRQVLEENNCLACHRRGNAPGIAGRLQSALERHPLLAAELPKLQPPALDSVGDKLTNNALQAAITKPVVRRDWLEVRMPTFSLGEEDLTALRDYFVTSDRVPPEAIRGEVAESRVHAIAGRRLVTADGFGCTSCHQVGSQKPREVTPAAHGPDLTLLGRLIRREWFDRLVRDPARIVPGMEMPSVQVPVPGVLEGELHQQLAAVWAILNEPGFEPPAPDAIRTVRQRNASDGSDRAIVLTDNLEVDGRLFVKPLLFALRNRHNILFDQQTYRLAGWRLGDAARQRTREKYWYWEAAGASIFASQENVADIAELQVEHQGTLLEPKIDPVLPPTFDSWHLANNGGVEFTTRLQFGLESKQSSPFQLRITQSFTPGRFEREQGFHRRVEVAGLPPGAALHFDLLPGGEAKVAPDRKTATAVGAPFRIGLSFPEALRFDESGHTSVRLNGAGGTLVFGADYRADLPADRYLKPEIPPAISEQVSLDVLPGFEAVRLTLPAEIMPTGFAWHGAKQRLLFTSLKGSVWAAEDRDGDGLEDFARPIGPELVAPYGIASATLSDGTEAIDVVDKTGLLRLIDSTSAGEIDRVETLVDGWGHSSDYHGWAVGLPKDELANYYVAVSQRKGPEQLLIGRVLQLQPRQPTIDDPRRYTLNPLTRGSRFPLGIARNRSGELFVTDNQGQYTVYNELNHVVPGAHFGHPSGLPFDEFKRLGKQGPSVAIPHPWTRSVNGICFLETPDAVRQETDRDLFGAWEGHLIGCEYDTRQLIRISLQRVGDQFQGAVYPFSLPADQDEPSLLGPVVCAVAPDGDLYVGNLRDSAWGAGKNTGEIVRARFTGELPAGIAEVRAEDDGLRIVFSTPVDPRRLAAVENYAIASYRRVATPAYGGPDVGRREEKIVSVEAAPDDRSVVIRLAELRRGHVYELHLRPLVADNQPFHPAEAYFTLGPVPQ